MKYFVSSPAKGRTVVMFSRLGAISMLNSHSTVLPLSGILNLSVLYGRSAFWGHSECKPEQAGNPGPRKKGYWGECGRTGWSGQMPVEKIHEQGWEYLQVSSVKEIRGIFHTLTLKPEVKRSEVGQSCPTLCDPMDCNRPGSSLHGILQAKILEWVAVPSSRGSFWQRNRTHLLCLSALQTGSLSTEPPGKPIDLYILIEKHASN